MVQCRKVSDLKKVDDRREMHNLDYECNVDGETAISHVQWVRDIKKPEHCNLWWITVNPKTLRGRGAGTTVLGDALVNMVSEGCQMIEGAPIAESFWDKFGIKSGEVFTLDMRGALDGKPM